MPCHAGLTTYARMRAIYKMGWPWGLQRWDLGHKHGRTVRRRENVTGDSVGASVICDFNTVKDRREVGSEREKGQECGGGW
jgi:hypothetical protein